MKYKALGIVNILIGSFQILTAGSMLLIVLPKMMMLYDQMDAVKPSNTLGVNYLTLATSLIYIFLGFKLLSKKTNNKEKYFNISLIFLLAAFLLAGITVSLQMATMMQPIYSLNEHMAN